MLHVGDMLKDIWIIYGYCSGLHVDDMLEDIWIVWGL